MRHFFQERNAEHERWGVHVAQQLRRGHAVLTVYISVVLLGVCAEIVLVMKDPLVSDSWSSVKSVHARFYMDHSMNKSEPNADCKKPITSSGEAQIEWSFRITHGRKLGAAACILTGRL